MRKKVELHRWQSCSMFGASEASPACCFTGRLHFEVEASTVQKWPQTCQISWEQLPTRWHEVRVCHFLWSSRFSLMMLELGAVSQFGSPLHTFHTSSSSSPLFSLGSTLRKCSSYFDTKVKNKQEGEKKQLSFPFHCFLAVISTVPLQQTSTTLTFAAKTVNKGSLELLGIFCVFFLLKRLKAYWCLFTVLSGQLLAGW